MAKQKAVNIYSCPEVRADLSNNYYNALFNKEYFNPHFVWYHKTERKYGIYLSFVWYTLEDGKEIMFFMTNL